MEQKLNRVGDTRGLHKHARGADHVSSKGWYITKDNEIVAYYPTLREMGEALNKDRHYLWLLSSGRMHSRNGNVRYTTKEGYIIKQAIDFEKKSTDSDS